MAERTAESRGAARGRRSLRAACLAAACLAAAPGAARAAEKSSPARGDAKADAQTAALERELLKATQKVQTAYLKELERIAVWASANGLPAEAREVAARMEGIDPSYGGLAQIKAKVASAQPKGGADEKAASAAKRTLEARLRTASENQAKRLFDLAKRCMQVGLFTRAYQLVKAVLAADPDHKQARTILNQVWDRESKTWVTKWHADMKKTHYLTPEGWVPLKDRGKWEKGLRPYLGKWVAKEEEARIRARNVHAPYSVETEHFEVRSSLGREKAFEFAARLEEFYGAFFEFFIGFWDQVAGAKLLFNANLGKKKHRVVVFNSREEYLDFVRSEKGNDELLVRSGGFWSGSDRQSYFYWTDDPSETIRTLYHETTHQLLGETKENAAGSAGNVWIVEGVAHYMELWEREEGRWLPGRRVDAPSMKAVARFLEENPAWSLAQFVGLDHKQFHDPKSRTLNYFLAGALAHFFLHYEDEVYREDFVRMLRACYEGKLRPDSLPEYVRVEGASAPAEAVRTLDRQFREYMKDLKPPGDDAAIVSLTRFQIPRKEGPQG